jgi:hypothetical protein
MASVFVVAAVISITFLVAKFLEMRFIEKETKPLKLLIRDALIVYFSVIAADFVMAQVNPVMVTGPKVTQVFTDNPGF